MSCQRCNESANGRRIDRAALLIRISTGPMDFTNPSIWSRSVRSAGIAVALPPAEMICSTTWASTSFLRATAITVAPWAANFRAATAPIPEDAPVNRMRLPRSAMVVRTGHRGNGRIPAIRSVVRRLRVIACPLIAPARGKPLRYAEYGSAAASGLVCCGYLAASSSQTVGMLLPVFIEQRRPGVADLLPLVRAPLRTVLGESTAADDVGIGVGVGPIDPALQVVDALLVQRMDVGHVHCRPHLSLQFRIRREGACEILYGLD